MTTITIEKAIVHRALSALEYHTQQTRPIHNTELVIEELRAALSAPATALNDRLRNESKRKPMTDQDTLDLFNRIQLRMRFTDADARPFASGVASAEFFHGIKGTP